MGILCTTPRIKSCVHSPSVCTTASHKKYSVLNETFIERETPEKCPTHKREIDRFCKSCSKLMCSVCQCPHARNENDIISDENLRDEVKNILKAYKNVDKAKQDLTRRKYVHRQKKTREVEERKISELNKITESTQVDISKIEAEKQANLKQVEEEYQRKIKEIEEVANQKTKKIEAKRTELLNKLNLEHEKRNQALENGYQGLQTHVETLQDLTKYPKKTLEECLAIYKLEQTQRTLLEEFLTINKCDIDSLLASRS